MNMARRRQSSADWAAREVTDFCDKNQACTTGWRRMCATNDDEFRDTVTEAAALHGAANSSPSIRRQNRRLRREQSDEDEDGTPPHADADEPELIVMPLAAASAPSVSNL